jgi:outer membrane protein W
MPINQTGGDMQRKSVLIVAFIVTLGLLNGAKAWSQENLYTTGIGLRASYYKMKGYASQVFIHDHDYYSDVNIGGFGGSLFLFSRINENFCFEITLGAIGHVEEQTVFLNEEEVDVSAINPLLFGVRFEPGRSYSPQNLAPYISAGAGPYWISDIQVRDTDFEDEVRIHTQVKHGGYFGAGLNFNVTDGFAINFDLKYHMINLDLNHENSGFEYGIGFHVAWGEFK